MYEKSVRWQEKLDNYFIFAFNITNRPRAECRLHRRIHHCASPSHRFQLCLRHYSSRAGKKPILFPSAKAVELQKHSHEWIWILSQPVNCHGIKIPVRQPCYYEGYIRGLRRYYHDKIFLTEEEHRKWLTHVIESNQEKSKAEWGGYLHGLSGENIYWCYKKYSALTSLDCIMRAANQQARAFLVPFLFWKEFILLFPRNVYSQIRSNWEKLLFGWGSYR